MQCRGRWDASVREQVVKPDARQLVPAPPLLVAPGFPVAREAAVAAPRRVEDEEARRPPPELGEVAWLFEDRAARDPRDLVGGHHAAAVRRLFAPAPQLLPEHRAECRRWAEALPVGVRLREEPDLPADDLGQPTINGMKALNFRIEKLMPKSKWSKKTLEELEAEEEDK